MRPKVEEKLRREKRQRRLSTLATVSEDPGPGPSLSAGAYC